MRIGLVALVFALASCGRIGFAPLGDGGGGNGGEMRDAAADARDIPAGALVWLKMDSGPTVGIVDSAGGHSSSCLGACPNRVPAVHDDGYDFTTEEVDVVGTPDLDVATGFTGAIWIRMTIFPAAQNACPWTKQFDGANGGDTFAFCIGSSGDVIFDGETPLNNPVTKTLSGAIAVGEWHHLASTWDGTTRRDYLDGVQQFMTATAIGHTAESLCLGSARGGFFTDGTLDDALYYGRALSPAEIQQLRGALEIHIFLCTIAPDPTT